MKTLRRLLLLALVTLAPAAAAHAQGTQALFSRDGLDVWAVGDSGRYYRSTDGGVVWSFANLGSRTLRAVAVRNLRVLVAGDSGRVYRSENNGGTWTFAAVAGIPALRAIHMVTDSIGWVVGDGGAIFKTVNAGAAWTPQASGTAQRLLAVRFTSPLVGWVAGAGGFVAKTTDGGAVWTPVAVGTTRDLLSLDVSGATLWVVGAQGTALRSVNGGAQWAPVNLRLDAKSDVRCVVLQSPDSVYLAGGGGFIRRSVDGGGTWTFLPHNLHAPISSLFLAGASGFAATGRNRVVIHSTNFGATWALPGGGTLKRSWTSRLLPSSPSVRGGTLTINPLNPNTLFCLIGGQVYRSRDEGETWQAQGNPIPDVIQTNAFVISAKDSNVFLTASVLTTISPLRRVFKSVDGGVTWSDKLTHDFGEYGIPLEVNPDKPDTVFFGGDNDSLYRSTDFGSTWAKWGTTIFRSPCDMIVVPDSSNIMEVGDGTTNVGQGQLWRSTDSGRTWSLRWTNLSGGSEVPGMSCSRLRNNVSFGTNWSAGGTNRSADYGNSWAPVTATLSTWGTDIAKDDPNVVMYAVYTGSRSWLSLDGATFATADSTHLPFANYSLLARDRALFLAEQSNGIWKMNFAYAFTPNNTQAITVTSPNGGEGWAVGSVHAITWTGTNLGLVRLEYRTSPADSWHLIADVAGSAGSYAWTVPAAVTAQALVRASDAWDAAPLDPSNAVFSITQPAIGVAPGSLAFGAVALGARATHVLTISNPGTGSLVVSGVSTGNPAFTTARTALSVPGGGSDTLGVTFAPTAPAPYAATLVLTSNAPTSPTDVGLTGSGTDTLHLALTAPNGGETWAYGTQHAVTWSSALVDSVALEVQAGPAGAWLEIAPTLPAAGGAHTWTIPDLETPQARVRVRQRNGALVDASDAVFAITVPRWQASPDPIDFGPTPVGYVNETTLHFQNLGSGALVLSGISSGNPDVHPGRTALTVPPGASDTLGVFYGPGAVAPDTCWLTFTSNDPGSPHAIRVTGSGTASTGVAGPPPTAFALEGSRPNPFTGSTLIAYALPVEARVALDVFDLQGQHVASLVQATQPAGRYSVRFGDGLSSGRPLGSGVYFVRLRAGSFAATRKLLRVR